MDDVFKALADPSRRQLLDSLNARNGQTLRSLCADLAMRLRIASVPIVIIRSTPAARAAAIASDAPPSNRSSSRWQWLSVQVTTPDQVEGTVSRGKSGAPFSTASPPG